MARTNNTAPRTLSADVALKYGTIADFKTSHTADESVTCAFVHSINKVTDCGDHYSYEFNNGEVFKLYFTGEVKKYAPNGRLKSTKLVTTGKYNERVRITINVNGKPRSLMYERAIMVGTSFIQDSIPLNIEVAEANMMNSSANAVRCNAMKIKSWDFRPSQIEWCSELRNKLHSLVVDAIYIITGRVYAISAYSPMFTQAFIDRCKDILGEKEEVI